MIEPFVSICIPTYNGEHYLKQCLDSCINQTYKDYEIVICDDGSIDATVEIIEAYAAKSARVRFFKNDKNLGLVANWNKCIEQSNGKWIKFVFQDDYIAENCLEKFVENIESSISLIVSKRNFILPHEASEDFVNYYTKQVRTLENTNYYNGNLFSPECISKIAVQNICLNFIGEPSLTFFKKEHVDELGFFNENLKQICDLEFMLRVATQHGLKYIQEKLCAFRIHNNSTTSVNVEKNYFQLHYIEPLVFSWFLLYGTSFKKFRMNLNVLEKMKLKMYFKTKAYLAYRANAAGNHQHFLLTGQSSVFKEIHSNKRGSILIWIFSLFRK